MILYAIPTPLGASAKASLPEPALATVRSLTDFLVENAKSAQSTADTAKRLIDAMDECLDPARSAKIIVAIAEYRRKIAPSPPGSP